MSGGDSGSFQAMRNSSLGTFAWGMSSGWAMVSGGSTDVAVQERITRSPWATIRGNERLPIPEVPKYNQEAENVNSDSVFSASETWSVGRAPCVTSQRTDVGETEPGTIRKRGSTSI